MSGLKKLVEKRNTENSSLQIKIDKSQMENEMLVDTNVNVVNKIKMIEIESKLRKVGLAIWFSLNSTIQYS